MLKNINNLWLYIGVILFILLDALCIYNECFYLNLLPVIILIFLIAFFALDKLLLGIVFLVPLSVPLSEIAPNLPIDMFLPTEPLLAGILLIFIFKIIFEGNFDKKITTHPVSISIYLYLTWMLLTSITSTMPLVSIKFIVSRLWFIVAFYFLASQLFKNENNIKQYISFYIYGLIIVVFYSLYRHITYGIFDEKIAHWASNPFYKDHTSYGALLTFYIPPAIALIVLKTNSLKEKTFRIIVTLILFIGLIFSYSRAAWVSLLGALFIWFIIRFKIKAKAILISITIVGIIISVFSSDLIQDLKLNKQDSSTKDISQHIKSISNISTDASNLERLNRWNCAIRMFKEKPLFGWGPGTYSFKYAPFQIASEKTIISTNNGDMGNAHSEYLGPLAEQGLLGLLLFLYVIITSIITGIRVIKNANNNNIRYFAVAVFLGLCTYYLHGFLNNFLDTDKASVPFWGFTAMLVVFDIYFSNKKNHIKKEVS